MTRGFTTTILHSDLESPIEHYAVHKPMHSSVAYGYPDARELAKVFKGESPGYVYGRQGNPTTAALEAKVTKMEDGIATACFSTGMSAIAATFIALLRAGDHVVSSSFLFGNTSREIVQMARESGARKVFFASAAPPVRFPNVYGIDMPTREELIACGRTEAEIAREIGCDELIYQDLEALREDVRSVNPKITRFEDFCFSGVYVTGDVTQEYLDGVEAQRRDGVKMADMEAENAQLDLGLETVD